MADSDKSTPATNAVIFQGFEWFCPADYQHWKRLVEMMPLLAEMGITSIWIPPACKSFYKDSVGYDIYDLYDLGEFDQKGAVHTKYGTKEELVELIRVADTHGISIIFDVVVNHKAGADYCEPARGVRVNPDNRLEEISGPEDLLVWTGFDYNARQGKHSCFKWNKSHFSRVDYDESTKVTAIWKLEGKNWAPDADSERGSFDYLMFANVDHQHEEVRRELFCWADWLHDQLKLGGVRLDAIKHMSQSFTRDFVVHLCQSTDPGYLILGEYWATDSAFLARCIEDTKHRMALYDIKLVYNFYDISTSPSPDLRTVFDGALMPLKPDHAVTFVTNHDTQELQPNYLPVAEWFVPLAYALILLHADSRLPCVFYPDIYGTLGPHGVLKAPDAGRRLIPKMVLARKLYAYGAQEEYFDEAHCVGFTRQGHPAHSGGCGLAVVMTTCWGGYNMKAMFVGDQHAGERWTDVLGSGLESVEIGPHGWAEFPVRPRSVAIWVRDGAEGREKVDSFPAMVMP